MASISNIKRLSNEAREAASNPTEAIPALRDAIWQLCEIIGHQQSEIEKLHKLIESRKKL